MKTFVRITRYIERNYPKVWANDKISRRILVRYFLPGPEIHDPVMPWNA